MARLTINDRQVVKLFEQLTEMPQATIKEGGKVFKAKTPVKSGNARSKTKTRIGRGGNDSRIEANYPYADKLNAGWSGQAPAGMSNPTMQQMDTFVSKYISRID